jgi:hypothetical protein
MASEVRDDNTLLWFPWTAFHEIHPARAKEREIRGIAPGDGAKFETGREAADQAASKLPARAPSLSGCANRNYRSLTTRPPYPLCRGAALQCFILKDRTTRFCTRMCHELSRSNHRWRLARPFPAHRRNLHMPPRILSNTWRTSHRSLELVLRCSSHSVGKFLSRCVMRIIPHRRTQVTWDFKAHRDHDLVAIPSVGSRPFL